MAGTATVRNFMSQLKARCPALASAIPEEELAWFVEHLPPSTAPQKLLYRVSEAAVILGRSESTLGRWASEIGGVYVPQRDLYGRYVMHRRQIELIAAVQMGAVEKADADAEWELFLRTQKTGEIVALPRRRREVPHA